MTKEYKILLNYVKDLSVETQDVETLLNVRNSISHYTVSVNIESKPLKSKMIEVTTKLTYTDPRENQKKAFFEILYATVIKIENQSLNKDSLQKIILCDLQIEIYPELEKIFLTTLRNSGYPELQFGKKIDFQELYNKKLS